MFETLFGKSGVVQKIARIHIRPMKVGNCKGIAVKYSGLDLRISQFHLYVSQNIAPL